VKITAEGMNKKFEQNIQNMSEWNSWEKSTCQAWFQTLTDWHHSFVPLCAMACCNWIENLDRSQPKILDSLISKPFLGRCSTGIRRSWRSRGNHINHILANCLTWNIDKYCPICLKFLEQEALFGWDGEDHSTCVHCVHYLAAFTMPP
jgi:hypothetical protein